MAEKKSKISTEKPVNEKETSTTSEKLTAAKEANIKAAKAAKEAAKANAEATAAVAKDTAKKTKKAAKKGAETAKKGAEAAKNYTKKPKKTVLIQYLGKEIMEDELIDRAIAQFSATEGAIPVKKIALYIKPEDMSAYYVINEQYTGCVDF